MATHLASDTAAKGSGGESGVGGRLGLSKPYPKSYSPPRPKGYQAASGDVGQYKRPVYRPLEPHREENSFASTVQNLISDCRFDAAQVSQAE